MRTRTARPLLALSLSLASLLPGCFVPAGRLVTIESSQSQCFSDVPALCVLLQNVETEGNCDFTVLSRRDGVDTTISAHTRIDRGARVPVTFEGVSYQLEVYSTVERIVHSDEATFVLHDAN